MKTTIACLVAAAVVAGFVAFPGSLEAGEFEIEVLDEGSEPRTELRLTGAPGEPTKTNMDVDMTMGISATGMSRRSVEMPTVSFAIATEVTGETSDGDLTFVFNYSDIGVHGSRDAATASMEEALGWLEDVSGYGTVNRNGIASELEYSGLEDAPAQVRSSARDLMQSMKYLTVPLPDEPIGVGGRWKARWGLEMNGMLVELEGTFTLLSRVDDVIRLRVQLEQTADEQEVKGVPGMPAGAKIKLNSLSATGSGELEIDLAQIMPRSGSVQIKSKADMEATMRGRSMGLKMDMDMTVTVSGG